MRDLSIVALYLALAVHDEVLLLLFHHLLQRLEELRFNAIPSDTYGGLQLLGVCEDSLKLADDQVQGDAVQSLRDNDVCVLLGGLHILKMHRAYSL